MSKNILDEYKVFINNLLGKYRAYAIIDIENRLYQRSSNNPTNMLDENTILKLLNKRRYYEEASHDELLADLLDSAKERLEEENMGYAKSAFDLVLSKRKFSSFH